MALITQTPTDPAISTAATNVPAGTANNFRTNLNTYVAAVELKAQKAVAYLEQLHATLGNGWLSGGDMSIGTGLSVNITALSAMVGHIVAFDATQAVGGLAASQTNYIYLREDGTWTINQTGTAPADTTAHGQSLLWGTAVTSVSAVTSVDQSTRPVWVEAQAIEAYPMQINSGQSVIIPPNYYAKVIDGFTNNGTLTNNGILKVEAI